MCTVHNMRISNKHQKLFSCDILCFGLLQYLEKLRGGGQKDHGNTFPNIFPENEVGRGRDFLFRETYLTYVEILLCSCSTYCENNETFCCDADERCDSVQCSN